ncbi:MAG: class I SAM-dependent methyltransferase, partial [Sphaerochaetaceae bacterium]|nr:class I SAM-dependent methyltransferase [Sphaerochaetaceae bacterium]
MDYLIKDFGKILKKNALMMRRLLLQENTDCMRVYDRNIEELPVSVELFSKYARITDYSEDGLSDELEDLVKDAVRRMCYVQGENVIFHRRAKRSNKEQHELQSTHSVTLEVNEASHRFKVDLTKRIDTGLFLDHYKTRKLVQSISDNKRVLNLFSYTGSFSVYAAAGNAQLVESIDLSKTYTDWAMHNLSINGFQGDKYPCITTDALKYVIDSVRNKKIYDLVIFDPPSFSNSRKMEKDFDVQRDYVRYLKFINNLLEKGGKVIFSTNLSSFHMDPGRLKGFEVKNITKDILADGFTKKKGTSRTWILEKVSKVKLTKEDYEGKKYFTVRENAKKERVKRMEEIQKNEENDFEKI